MPTVLITGGTGLIGKHLCKKLQKKGYTVSFLSRTKNKKADATTFVWNIKKNEIEPAAIASADYIIHLAGVNIGDKRWTVKRKQEIISSRVKSGQLIFNEIKKQNKTLRAFISASAVGYYGTINSEKEFSETDLPSDDFLGNICQQWEKTTDSFNDLGIRTVKIRIGIVLAKQGGVLSKLRTLIYLKIGAIISNGKQYFPWIHIEDLCDIYVKALEDEKMSGAYNAVAPEHTTNEELTKAVAKKLSKKIAIIHIPAFIMNIVFGEMSIMLLKGNRISTNKLMASGFNFKFPKLELALTDLLKK